MSTTLQLAPEPRSVGRARAWVVDELATIGRDDLADSAELGVSELVTNAILHGDPPIVVRLGGTSAHPRVEVHDRSTMPPAVRDLTDDAQLMATVGRGLGIVAMYSSTWGAEVSVGGKVVWFEPAVDPSVARSATNGEIFDLSRRLDALVAAAGEPDDLVVVRLLGMPVRAFVRYRIWYDELRRELRLLALNHGVDYPLASELSHLTLQVAREHRQARGFEPLDAAITAGDLSVDLEYHVPPSMPASMGRLRIMLEEADAFCREQRLLTVEPSHELVALRSWYHGEFERQGRGEPALPWPGGYQD